jgi:hypothetical protein
VYSRPTHHAAPVTIAVFQLSSFRFQLCRRVLPDYVSPDSQPPPPPGGRRPSTEESTIDNYSQKWPDALNLVLGLWLLFSPFLGFGNVLPAAAWNAWAVGAIVAAVALLGLTKPELWQEWINLVGGLWIFLAPFAFFYNDVADTAWNHLLVGGAIATIGAIGVARRQAEPPAEPA